MSLQEALIKTNRRIAQGSSVVGVGLSAMQAVLLWGKKSSTAFDCALTITGEVQSSRVPVDVAISQSHERTSEVTDHAVEDGSVITDNIVNRPIRLHIEAIVTDAPIRFLSGVRTLLDGGGSRAQTAFDALNELWEKRLPIIVATRRKIYHQMVFTNLVFAENADNVEAIRFTADMKQVTIVSQAFDELAVKPAVKDKASKTKPKGKQPPKPVTPKQQDQAATHVTLNDGEQYALPRTDETVTPTTFVPQ